MFFMCYSMFGDYMKTDIIYSNETLFIYLNDNLNKKEIKMLKNKMDNIINEYQINDVVIDTKNIGEVNDLIFTELINDYRRNEIIIKKV